VSPTTPPAAAARCEIVKCLRDRPLPCRRIYACSACSRRRGKLLLDEMVESHSRLAFELCLDRRDVASKRHALTTLVSVASHLWRFHHGRYLSWLFLDPNCLP